MRLLALSLLVLAPLTATAAPRPEKLDALVGAYHRLDQFTGSALVAEKGKVVFKKGYGLANREWDVPNAPDTKFRLGSITKQFTSMLVMQLVHEGKIKLDEPMLAYLPDYRADTGQKVTVRHLLTHTSGIPSYTGLPGFLQEVSRNPSSVADFVKRYASGDLEFEPGSKYAYNNSGYFLLGAILERVAGKPYEKLVQERIFEPLGMKDSGYDRHQTVLPKRAAGYERTPEGVRNAAYLDMSLPYAAGSLYSTVEDLFRWDRALAAHTLLPKEEAEVMTTPVRDNYAFGWVVHKRKLADGKTEVAVHEHGGGINGFNTLLVRVPETGELVVLLDNYGGGKLNPLASGLLSLLRGQEAPPPKQSLVGELLKVAAGGDVAAALARLKEVRAKEPARYDASEGEVNQLGYQLLGRGRAAEAVEIFKWNVEEHPGSWNVYDSLGEAYATQGNRELAVASYKKSLELNPKNDGAAAALKKLEQPAVAVDAAALDKYAGEYALAPGFTLVVRHEGDKLTAQATNQPKLLLAASGPATFDVVGVKASLVFAEDGASLVLHQGGRATTGKRLVKP